MAADDLVNADPDCPLCQGRGFVSLSSAGYDLPCQLCAEGVVVDGPDDGESAGDEACCVCGDRGELVEVEGSDGLLQCQGCQTDFVEGDG